MKKTIWIGTTCFFLLAVLFINLGSASAASLPAPMATPVSGDQVFSTKVVSTSSLMGITTTSDGLVMPKGFPMSEKQFEGDALVLSGLDYGSVNVCFPIAAVNQGWGGKVGFWDGSAWKLQETSITTPAESSLSWGCAKVYQNGTYAFLKWVTNPSLLPKTPSKPECAFTITNLDMEFDKEHLVIGEDFFELKLVYFSLYSYENLEGKDVKVTYTGSSPQGLIWLDGKPSNVFFAQGIASYEHPNEYSVPLIAPIPLQINLGSGDTYPPFTLSFLADFGTCISHFSTQEGG